MTTLDAFRAKLGYTFREPALLDCALTHRSADRLHNERLEFLGDAVLNLVISHVLYQRFPDADEGDLSRLRARLVNGESLGNIAATLDLGNQIKLGGGELKSGGFRRRSIMADAVEAIIGAIFLDGGMPAAETFILKLYQSALDASRIDASLKDPKTQLQEWLQAHGKPLPVYQVIEISGKQHNQSFVVSCQTETIPESVRGHGSSRRKAEQAAAQQMLAKIVGNS